MMTEELKPKSKAAGTDATPSQTESIPVDPTSFYGALQKKYSDSSIGAPRSVTQIYLPSTKHGMTDGGGWNIPKFLNLDGGVISTAGNIIELAKYCQNVMELNLAQNALTSWEEIFTILECMPRVEFLNLSHNPLATDIRSDVIGSPPCLELSSSSWNFRNVHKLVLNSTKLPLIFISRLLTTVFKNLQELYLSNNDYATTEDLGSCPSYPSLLMLQLSGNRLSDWGNISKVMCTFSNVQTLFLAENPLTVGAIAAGAKEEGCFDGLTSLNLNSSSVCEWAELESLAAMPSLAELRLMFIPLTERLDKKLKRQLVIASLSPRISRLNGSTISADERDEAERAYLRHFSSHTAQAKPHRFYELEQLRGGLPQPLANVSLAPATSAIVTIVHGEKREQLTIQLRQTVAGLKKLLQTFAGLPSVKFDLYHQDPVTPHGADKLIHLQKWLYALNVRDGDIFYVQPRSMQVDWCVPPIDFKPLSD